MREAVSRLPEKQRATLILKVYHDLTHEEVAAILGSSVGTVKANLFHALGNLRKAMAGAAPDRRLAPDAEDGRVMMWTHASDAALMDVVEGAAGDRARAARAPAVRAARARVDEARAALASRRRRTVPEPSRSSGTCFAGASGARSAKRRPRRRGGRSGPRPRSRQPCGRAVLMVGPSPVAGRPAPRTALATLPAWSPLPPADEDPALPLLEQAAPAVVAAARRGRVLRRRGVRRRA